MKALALVMLFALCQLAAAAPSYPPGEQPKTAAQQKQQCEAYLADQKTPAADICFAYARGMKDALDGALAWLDDTHKRFVIGTWADGVTVDQLVRVFVKFANDNPQLLNQPAPTVFRQSAEAANLYSYATAN
jgi:hypothetical protein